jgi:hypothetical protein
VEESGCLNQYSCIVSNKDLETALNF